MNDRSLTCVWARPRFTGVKLSEFFDRPRLVAAAFLDTLEQATESHADAILFMKARIQDFESELYRSACRSKPMFIHIDLVRGLSGEREAVEFLKHTANPDAVVSTKGASLRAAQRLGIQTIQRIFLIDSQSLQRTIGSIVENGPDAIEIMPGVAPSIVPLLRQEVELPLILGGLIQTERAIAEGVAAGADGVSMSSAGLWNIRPENACR